MNTTAKLKLSLLALGAALAAPAASQAATTVGTIFACYACQNSGDPVIDAALVANPSVAGDGLLFEFNNTSGAAITGATFDLVGNGYVDAYALPVLAADSSTIFIPGIDSDGGVHPSGSLFATVGYTMDTSDGQGSVNDSSVFSFTGVSGALAVTSGNFTPGDAALILPFRDNPANGSTSFVGQGPSGDGGCNNCYFGQIATLTVPSVSAAPEPATWSLMLAGVGVLGASLRGRRRPLAAV